MRFLSYLCLYIYLGYPARSRLSRSAVPLTLSGFYSFRYPFVHSFQFIFIFSHHLSLRRGRGVLFLFPHSSFGFLFYHRTTPGQKFPVFHGQIFVHFICHFCHEKSVFFSAFSLILFINHCRFHL